MLVAVVVFLAFANRYQSNLCKILLGMWGMKRGPSGCLWQGAVMGVGRSPAAACLGAGKDKEMVFLGYVCQQRQLHS